MRTLLLCTLLLLSGILYAQTIDNPTFKTRTGSITNISRIERTPECTRLYIHAIFRPHWWIKVGGSNYLEDVATGKKYKFKSAEGIELNKEVYMPDSGTKDYVLTFEALPKETQAIHLLNPTSNEGNTYDISLVPQTKKNASPLTAISGNWFSTDESNAWEYGIYDSICIMNNRIYSNESIRKKGKKVEIAIKDKVNGNISTLLVTPLKDGNCKIQANGKETKSYTRQCSPIKAMAPDEDFQQFFRRDTTYLQGYIDGYDRRLGFDTGLIYLGNAITGEDFPTVVEIDKDGSFKCKFVISYPMEEKIVINRNWIPFYIEPGQTLTMYISWEDLLARSRSRDYNFPIKNTAYMGPSASLSHLVNECNKLISYPYSDLSKSQKTLTPNQYKEHMKSIAAKWNHIADTINQNYRISPKATRFIKNKISLLTGKALMDFLMSREYYAREDTTNQALKVKEDDTYYDFLKEMPLNDETVLADSETSIFINRFEFMGPLNNAYSLINTSKSDSITITYPEKSLLSFLKENGVKLNAELEAMRIEQDKLVGKTVRMLIDDIRKENEKLKDIRIKEDKLTTEYQNTIYKEHEQRNREKSRISFYQDLNRIKDTIIAQLCGEPNPLLWQIAKVRGMNHIIKEAKTSQIAREYVDNLKQTFTQPFLVSEAERIFTTAFPEKNAKSYQLPEGKATDVFRNIIKNHQGKVLFVDFWATSCGPCRGGIEATADLRKKYKNHPEFQFIYITGRGESPEKAYKQYVDKHLKGEASYYVTETEYNYLRQLFQFNGIPHYELVNKDGSISKEEIRTHTLEEYLNKHFPMPEPSKSEENVQ